MRAGSMSPSVRFASSEMSTSQYHTTTTSPHHVHLGPMALPKSNQQPDPKPLPLLRPWQKAPKQIDMMR
jgi:hypothetical protein